MTPVCGFKDSKGRFYEKEEDCQLADAQIKMDKLLAEYYVKLFPDSDHYGYNYTRDRSTIWQAVKFLLRHPELFQQYAKQASELTSLQSKPEKVIPDIKESWWKFW